MGLATPGSNRYQIQYVAATVPGSGVSEFQLEPDAPGTPALLASTKFAATSSAGGTTPAIDTTGATLLIAWISADSPGTFTSDSKGNTWSRGIVRNAFNNPSACSFYFCSNPTSVGTGHTFTCGGNFPLMIVAAFSGTRIRTVFSSDSGISYGAVGSATVPPLVPVTNQLLLASIGTWYTAGSVSIDSGFTIIDQQVGVSSQHYAGALAYKIAPSTAVVTPTWTISSPPGVNGTVSVLAQVAGRRIAIAQCQGAYRKTKFINPVDQSVTARYVVYLGSGVPDFTYVGMDHAQLIDVAATMPTYSLNEISLLTTPSVKNAVLVQEMGRYRKRRAVSFNLMQIQAIQAKRFVNIEGAFVASHFGGILNVPIMV